jgi:tetratricopeptide (TPR) repeat protein
MGRSRPYLVKFVVTPRRREAMRANLVKARAAIEVRGRPYRRTAKRLAAARANLRQAQAARAARGSPLRHGLYCASLRRSLGRAGESPEEFEQHLRLFRRAFEGRPEAASPDPNLARLVQAAAEVTWRRLRAYRGLAQCEVRAFRRTLAGAPVAESLSADEAGYLGLELLFNLRNYERAFPCIRRLNRRLEDILDAVLQRRSRGSRPLKVVRKARLRQPISTSLPLSVVNNPLQAAVVTLRRQREESEARGSSVAANPPGIPTPRGAPDRGGLEDITRLLERAFVPAGADAELRQLAQATAEAAGARLRCFAAQASREAEGVKQILGALDASGSSAARSRRAAARALLELLDEGDDVEEAEYELSRVFGVRLTGLLVRQYPTDPSLQAWHRQHERMRKIF